MLTKSRMQPLVAAVVALVLTPAAAAATVANPSAEEEGGWSGSAARFASYGEGPDVPSAQFATEHRGFGARLFALEPAGRLEQVVDVSDLAAGIDAGGTTLYSGAWLGADGAAQGGARLTATPLDATGRELAPAAFAGPPTRSDRASLSLVVPCDLALSPPAGTRQVRLALEGVGPYETAAVDAVYLEEVMPVAPAMLLVPSSGRPSGPGEGPGCSRWDPTPIGPNLFPPFDPKPRCSPVPARQPGSKASSSEPIRALPAPPAPPAPVCASPLRLSHLALTRTRLSLRVSGPATVRVRLARRATRPRAAKWRPARNVTLRARRAGRVTRRLRRLRPGRYRISVRSANGGAGSLNRTLRRTLPR